MNRLSNTPYQIIAIGEVLWDVFPTGPRFGGAPANFACSAAELANHRAIIHMVSAVGRDSLGEDALAALRSHGVQVDNVDTVDFPTGQVLIQLDDQGRASYEFAANCAWDNLAWTSLLSTVASKADAVCFGTLGQRSQMSQQVVQRFIDKTSSTTWRVFDINLRPPFYAAQTVVSSLQLANVLKLNEEELPWLSDQFELSGTVHEQLAQLRDRFELRVVALTLGDKGAVLLRGEEFAEHPGVKTDVVDTVGAGDAFTAALLLGLLDDKPLAEILASACEVAAFVCSQPGATPNFPMQL